METGSGTGEYPTLGSVGDEQWAHSLHGQQLSGEQEGIDPPPQINLSL